MPELPPPPAATGPHLPPIDPSLHRPPWPLASWSVAEAVPVFFMCFGIELYLSIVVVSILGVRGGPAGATLGVLTELGFAIPVVLWLRATGRPVAELGLGRRSGADVFAGVGMGFLSLFGVAIVAAATVAVATAVEGHAPHVSDPIEGSGPWRAIGYASAVVLAPVCEEILFRGLLFQGLRRRFRFWPAALLTSVAFAIAHVDVLRMPGTFVGGLLLAAIVERRRSLFSSIAAHFVVNGAVIWATLASR